MRAVSENIAKKGPRPEFLTKKPRRKKRPAAVAVVDQKGCTGCEACIAVCPVDCIERVGNIPNAKFGRLVEVDLERCTGCEDCVEHCAWDAIAIFDLSEAGWIAPSLTLTSVCNLKTKDDIHSGAETLITS